MGKIIAPLLFPAMLLLVFFYADLTSMQKLVIGLVLLGYFAAGTWFLMRRGG